jgi:hypothetical protein
MAAPTSPYCEPADVAAIVPQLIHMSSDFSTETNPTRMTVLKFIKWKSSQIDMAFASLGFYVPYEEISGESWPDAQTYMLELMTSFGVAGMIVGPVVKPAPAMGRESGRSENAFTAAYNSFLESIPVNAAGFRMNYRPATKAEKICRTARGPITDHLLGYIDPTRFQTVDEYTVMIEGLRTLYGIKDSWLPWDHLKTRRDTVLA